MNFYNNYTLIVINDISKIYLKILVTFLKHSAHFYSSVALETEWVWPLPFLEGRVMAWLRQSRKPHLSHNMGWDIVNTPGMSWWFQWSLLWNLLRWSSLYLGVNEQLWHPIPPGSFSVTLEEFSMETVMSLRLKQILHRCCGWEHWGQYMRACRWS